MGKTNFHIDVDGNGNGNFHFEKVTVFSIRINADAVIDAPAGAEFDISLTVNGTRIGNWHVRSGEHVHCSFKTGSKLKLDIAAHSSVPNTRIEGVLSY